MYLSDKAAKLRKLLKVLLNERQDRGVENPSETVFFNTLVDLVEDISKEIDLLNNKTQEIEEYSENMSMDLHDIQELVIKNLSLNEDDDDNDDEHEDHEGYNDEFITLQCPFCEELFFIEPDELGENVECPFCNKDVNSQENRIKH
ncbi:MAG: hypothetical protein K0S55_108 [Clostridia bacterium]|jgi:uncharacterized protein YfkK (UPF0435 family)|nr:hypothetical protein [Clostridia bacterium]